MAGKRMLHKNICISEKLSDISFESECLYYRIMVLADDYGRFHANPHTVKDLCMPYRHGTNPERIRKMLGELRNIGLIHIYTVHNVDYLEIEKFNDFQILRNDVKKREDYPSRNEVGTDTERKRVVEDKDKDKVEDKEREAKASTRSSSFFQKPDLQAVKDYCIERKNYVSPEGFFNYYESNGWKVGRNPMKDWKACVRKWESGDNSKNRQNLPPRKPIPPKPEEEDDGVPMSEETKKELKDKLKNMGNLVRGIKS